jgi:two-component system sensor histidine kinase KdpD
MPDSDLTSPGKADLKSPRGLLKIFLGYAPGVGKTFQMLEEAHRRKRRDQDVVIGVIDSKGREETEQETIELEKIPLNAKGELNVPAILQRKPGVVLIDDIQHTNAAGSDRPKRWQDVEVILCEGIAVLATLGVQNLESLNDHIRDITGLTVDETVPDQILHSAEEIELVDLTPRALLNRIERGVVYPGREPDAETLNFYREGNLNALREIAMREAAGRVDEDLSAYRKDKNIERPWATNDRVMICVSPNRNSLRLIRRGWRVGQRLRGEVVAVHVEESNLSEQEAKILKDDFALAERLGIRTVTLRGNVATQLIGYAKDNSITQILLGHPERTRVQEVFRANLVSELARALRTVDITVVAAESEQTPKR